MTEGKVTIYDVAKAAGVAPSTVSRTFARPGRVTTETAEKIRRIAEELGYRANPVVRALASTQTKLIGMMVSDVANPFYSHLIRGAQLVATELGYELLLVDSRESGARERTALEHLVPVVEGFMIGSTRMSDSALRTIAKQRPTVVMNRPLRDVPSVVSDHAQGAEAALDLLAELRHESVLYVSGPDASWPNSVRSRALHDGAAKRDMTFHKTAPYLPTFEGGLAAAKSMTDRLPTAVICYNDLVAIGLMHGLQAAGVKIPDQVSVIGFDDIITSRLVTPPLTTVASPTRQMGAMGVKNVVAMIKGAQHKAVEALVIPVQLRVRGSTGPRRSSRAGVR